VLLLCCLSANTLFAQTATGYMLFGSGSVLVNGKLASGATSVAAGDTIETLPGSVAKISAPGVSMLLAEKSKVTVGEKSLSVTSGSAIVSANRGMGGAANLENLAAEQQKPDVIYKGCTSLSISTDGQNVRLSGLSEGPATLGANAKVGVAIEPCDPPDPPRYVRPKVWVPIAAAETGAIIWVLTSSPNNCFPNSNQPISVTCPK
jgi:hypothetical protein